MVVLKNVCNIRLWSERYHGNNYFNLLLIYPNSLKIYRLIGLSEQAMMMMMMMMKVELVETPTNFVWSKDFSKCIDVPYKRPYNPLLEFFRDFGGRCIGCRCRGIIIRCSTG